MGTFHFLFSDIEASTRLWEEYPDGMGDALKEHDRVSREAVAEFGGSVFKHTGDVPRSASRRYDGRRP